MRYYDYIIVGAGAAGLSLAYQLSLNNQLRHKRTLLLEAKPKTQNDRTWCFWTDSTPPFADIVFRRWQQLSFHTIGWSGCFDISPFSYYMLRGIDFYQHCFQQITRSSAIDIEYAHVQAIDPRGIVTLADGRQIAAEWIFDSRYQIPTEAERHQMQAPYLLQHFKGYVVRSQQNIFEPHTATFMDFRLPQQNETRFVYIMPFSANEALIEFTIFGKHIYQANDYTHAWKNYVAQYYPQQNFEVLDQEFGIIPMSLLASSRRVGAHVPIGIRAGCAKASTGYAFLFIQRHTQAIIQALLQQKAPPDYRPPARFRFYDAILLDVLHHQRMPSDEVFYRLFRRISPQRILRFLLEQTHLHEELQIMYHLHSPAFLQALWSVLKKQSF